MLFLAKTSPTPEPGGWCVRLTTNPLFYLTLHERSPISNLTLINLLNNLRFNLEVSFHIHQSIDLLLHIADLGVTEAAAIWDFLDGCSNIIKTLDKIFFCIDFITISPSGIIVVESDSTR
mgnify:FL=1